MEGLLVGHALEARPMHHNLEPGYRMGGRYRVVRKLAEGGIGHVYVVFDPASGRERALKLLKEELCEHVHVRERFLREATAPARIDSQSVVEVLEVGVDAELGDAPFVVMELLEGIDLMALSERAGPLPPPQVLGYLQQLAVVLDRAHARGVVHRDLKPDNLFVVAGDDGREELKLLDFGAAKVLGIGGSGGEVTLSVTRTGDFFGTPLYMSPEQCLGRSHQVAATTDVWALGLIACRLLAGVEYWTAQTLAGLVAQIAYEPMPPPSLRGLDFGELFDDWFAICCARDPALRFQRAGAALRALAFALA
jgi:serine/threonine protein kinase